ncbi:MAG: hypothetical protein D6B26_03660, partial [Spirochaetaceae bacterium]
VLGVIEEVGVYFRNDQGNPSIHTAEFRRVKELQYAGSLVYAESFLGDVAEDISVAGNAYVLGGALNIGPGAEVRLPEALFAGEAIQFELQFMNGKNGGASPSALVRIEGQSDGETVAIEIPYSDAMRFSVAVRDNRLVISDYKAESGDLVKEISSAVIVVKNTSDTASVLRLKHALAHYDIESTDYSHFVQGN